MNLMKSNNVITHCVTDGSGPNTMISMFVWVKENVYGNAWPQEEPEVPGLSVQLIQHKYKNWCHREKHFVKGEGRRWNKFDLLNLVEFRNESTYKKRKCRADLPDFPWSLNMWLQILEPSQRSTHCHLFQHLLQHSEQRTWNYSGPFLNHDYVFFTFQRKTHPVLFQHFEVYQPSYTDQPAMSYNSGILLQLLRVAFICFGRPYNSVIWKQTNTLSVTNFI